MILTVPAHLPRNAFSPRNAARAGDIWRLFQDVATDASSMCGWPPSRYRAEGNGFIVRAMTTVHLRETPHGETLTARTWVRDFRRGILTTREIRVDGERGPLAACTQEWVHVRVVHHEGPDQEGAGAMKPVRASAELLASFQPTEGEPSPVMPAWEPVGGAREHRFAFRAWHTWMDPLGHANHPAYVDWCDEATSVAMARAGLDPLALAPVAETVAWKLGIVAPEEVTVTTRVIGRTAAGDLALDHQISRADGALCAQATTVRKLVDGGTEALLAALS